MNQRAFLISYGRGVFQVPQNGLQDLRLTPANTNLGSIFLGLWEYSISTQLVSSMTNRIGDTKHNIYCSIGEWKLRFLAIGSCLNERTLKTDVDEGVAFWWRIAEKDTSCWNFKAF